MNTYKVAIEWAVMSEVEVQANSLEEAIIEVENNDSLVPTDGAFIDGSLTINHDVTVLLNKKSLS